jgi:hypothetical protein
MGGLSIRYCKSPATRARRFSDLLFSGCSRLPCDSTRPLYLRRNLDAGGQKATGKKHCGKSLFQEFIKVIAGAEAVAVVQVEFFAAALYHQFVADDGGAKLFGQNNQTSTYRGCL